MPRSLKKGPFVRYSLEKKAYFPKTTYLIQFFFSLANLNKELYKVI